MQFSGHGAQTTSATPALDDTECYAEKKTVCPKCGSLLRPDLVFFGERSDLDAEWAVKMALRKVDLFISVGTSGTVSPSERLHAFGSVHWSRDCLHQP